MVDSSLFSPHQIGSARLSNRVVLAPLTRGRAGDSRIPNELMATYYQQRATAGMIITEATVVTEEGIGWIGSPGIYNEEMVSGWKKTTEAVGDTPIFLQLWHCGRASHSDFLEGDLPYSASAIKLEGDHIHTPQGKKSYETPRAMTEEDIARTVGHYRQAAEYAKAAGFTGVEVHGANGYLINQFTESRTNHRTDHYGGSMENRFRFFREIVEAVLTVFKPEQVGARISPNGVFNDMGSEDFRAMNLYIAEQLNALGLGYLHVMDGLAFGFHELGEPMTLSDFRPVFKQTIIGNCGYTQETAQTAIDEGQADLIAFGRPFISNPDLVARFKSNQPLNAWEDMSHWYGGGAEGYTSYSAL